MSKTVKIPAIGANPFVVRVGGQDYSYAAGSTQTVPDAVADVVENVARLMPHTDPEIADKQTPTVREVKALIADAMNGPDAPKAPLEVEGTDETDTITITASLNDIAFAYLSGMTVYLAAKFSGFVTRRFLLMGAEPTMNDDPELAFVLTFVCLDPGTYGARPIVCEFNESKTGVISNMIAADYHFPVSVTIGESGATATTTATYAEVKSMVEKGITVVADVTIDNELMFYLPLKSRDAGVNPTVLVFAGALDTDSDSANPQPEIVQLVYTSSSLDIYSAKLAVAED